MRRKWSMKSGTAVSETRDPSMRFTVETRAFLMKIRQAYSACLILCMKSAHCNVL